MTNFLKKINPHLHDKLIFIEGQKEFLINPVELLTPNRFDLLAKYIYIYCKSLGIGMGMATQLYKDHIHAFSNGSFVEGDKSAKNSYSDYLNIFNKLIADISLNGFDNEVSLLPITNNNVAIDGSHRLAICLYNNIDINCLKFEELDPNYNFEYFLKQGLHRKWTDIMAIEYAKLKKNTYLAIVFPSAKGKETIVEKIFDQNCKIVYKKEITLSEKGLFNLVKQIYSDEIWSGNYKANFKEERAKAKDCYLKDGILNAYLLEADDLNSIAEAKEEVRKVFNIGNNSIHTTDFNKDTIKIAELLFNNNTILYLNNTNYLFNEKIEMLINEYKAWININNYNKDHFCIDGSLIMTLYGIREAEDLDFLSLDSRLDSGIKDVNIHNEEEKYHEKKVDDLIMDPDNYFYYNGLKCITLQQIKKMKLIRDELKDKKDIILINKVENNKWQLKNYLIKKILYLKINIKKIPNRIISFVKRNIPERLLPLAKNTFSQLKKLVFLPYTIKNNFGSFEKSMHYLNYELHFTRGYSLIARLNNKKIYEPAVTNKIIQAIKIKDSSSFLDIGANIGLISLNILANIPEMKIYAIEPGPIQFQMFKKTIEANNLEQIQLYKIAFGEKAEIGKFSIHKSKDASGDGFYDTKRSGNVEIIEVNIVTLDEWWKSIGNPEIKVVKIDTEGAELMVLNGAEKFISICAPIILIEINKINLKAYPYLATDILSWFEKNNYYLKMFDNTNITNENIDAMLELTDEFIAFPKNK